MKMPWLFCHRFPLHPHLTAIAETVQEWESRKGMGRSVLLFQLHAYACGMFLRVFDILWDKTTVYHFFNVLKKTSFSRGWVLAFTPPMVLKTKYFSNNKLAANTGRISVPWHRSCHSDQCFFPPPLPCFLFPTWLCIGSNQHVPTIF